ncbi:MAG: hypothetical protein ACI8PW_002001 [Methylophilaceae bacterium]|jgi:hypothetical protein
MLDSLLRKGYLPQELPPLFNSSSFANYITNNAGSLDAIFTQENAKWSSQMHHNLARVGGLRRRLSVPNPINFYRLAKAFDVNSELLETQWNQSPFSQTTPSLQGIDAKRAIAPRSNNRSYPRTIARVGAKYLLKADISQFYSSIYTHTVPWAIHSKVIAKANFRNDLYGNLIDKELQACQYGQTKGVAIGTDTSLGIAELILADIDKKLNESCKILDGIRFIDDIELSFSSLADAEHALVQLEKLLHEYELQLNVSKTTIISLPDSIESPYVSELRQLIPPKDNATQNQWVDYFNKAYILAKLHPADGVLRYAISALKNININQKVWKVAQCLLWQSIASDPGTIRFIIDVLWLSIENNNELQLDKEVAQNSLDSLILSSAPVGHSSEIVWGLWAGLLFKLELSNSSHEAILEMDDTFVAITMSVAIINKIFKQKNISPLWKSWLEPGCFHGAYWMYAYEAYKQGWLPDEVANSGLPDTSYCKSMAESGVSFINLDIISNYDPNTFENETLIASGSGG